MGAPAAVGGFEIATMAGFYFGTAEWRMPVMVDGLITSAAALTALAMEPGDREAMFFAHCSAQIAHRRAAIGIGMVETAIRLYREMATFQDLV